MLARILVVIFSIITLSTSLSIQSFAQEEITLHSEAALLMDGKTGQVLYEEQGHKQMYPASITKIVTGIMALEMADPEERVTISKKSTEVEGTSVYLLEDEEVSLQRLVQGLMINSGNDAGHAIAEHIADSEEEFSEKMNEFVRKKTNVENTNFTNPHGLFNENHYTTAYDMAEITRYALRNDDFRNIVSTKEMEWNGEGWETDIYNHNRMLWRYEGAFGVKNGFVQMSGFTLVTAAERDGHELIAVVLKSGTAEQSYQDTEKLLDYGYKAYDQETLPEGKEFSSEEGTLFYAPHEIKFSLKKGAEPGFNVEDEEKGLLKIKDGNDEIYEVYLPKRNKESLKKEKEGLETESAERELKYSDWTKWPSSSKARVGLMRP